MPGSRLPGRADTTLAGAPSPRFVAAAGFGPAGLRRSVLFVTYRVILLSAYRHAGWEHSRQVRCSPKYRPRDEEGAVTGALAPTKPLTAVDRCDRCGAQAYVRAVLAGGGDLLF